MHYLGLIFDFNGVLLWDAALQRQAWDRIAGEIRGRALDEEEFASHVAGCNNRYTIGYLAGKPLAETRYQEIQRAKEKHYRELCLAHPELFRLSPGAADLMDHLREIEIPFAIATASPEDNVDFFLQHLALERWLAKGNILFDDGTLPGKPSPDCYLKAASLLETEPGDCIVIEDALSGVEAARQAGIGYIIALGPGKTHEKLVRCEGVNEVIENLKQVETKRLFRLHLKPDTL